MLHWYHPSFCTDIQYITRISLILHQYPACCTDIPFCTNIQHVAWISSILHWYQVCRLRSSCGTMFYFNLSYIDPLVSVALLLKLKVDDIRGPRSRSWLTVLLILLGAISGWILELSAFTKKSLKPFGILGWCSSQN